MNFPLRSGHNTKCRIGNSEVDTTSGYSSQQSYASKGKVRKKNSYKLTGCIIMYIHTLICAHMYAGECPNILLQAK